MLPLDVPIDPDADTARQWLVDELAKPQYHENSQSLMTRVLDWINRLFTRADDAAGNLSFGGVPGAIVAIILVGAIIGVALYLLMGPLRRSRTQRSSASVFEDDERSADAMRRAAEEAAARGDWDTAVIERFRSVVRRAENDEWVSVVPGMTAYEFAVAAARVATHAASDLLWAGELFDGVRYGHASGSREAYDRMCGLERAVGAMKRSKVSG